MTKSEIESKIADLKAKKGNKSLPESAIKSLDKMIGELEEKLAALEPKTKGKKSESTKDEGAEERNEKLAEMLSSGENPDATAMWDGFTPAQQKSFIDHQYETFTDFSEAGNWEDGKPPTRKHVEKETKYLIELGRKKPEGKTKKATKKAAEPKKKEVKKAEPSAGKSTQYNCDDLIEEAKTKAAKAKARAAKKAAEPKKTEATKAKERIEKTHASIEKKVEAGEFKKPQLQKLISETEDLLTMLKKALKNL